MYRKFIYLIGIIIVILSLVKTRDIIKLKIAPEANSKININYIENKIKNTWKNTNEIWPKTNYNNHNLILFEVNEKGKVLKAWCLNTNGKKLLKKKEYESIEIPMPGGYSKIEFEGKPSISISFDKLLLEMFNDDCSDFIYTLATHELIHFYYQENININGTRFVKFPQEFEPRVYRTMIYKNLAKAYIHEESKEVYIAKAKYWYDKWLNKYPEEYKNIKCTDIGEGQAKYFECSVSGISPGINQEKKNEFLKNNIDLDMYFTTIDGESYELGYVAGLVLDGVKPGWKKNFLISGKTILEVLFENKKSIIDLDYIETKYKIKIEIEKLNKKNGGKIAGTIKALKDPNISYLKINQKYLVGSYEVKEFLDYNGNSIMVGLTSRYKNNDWEIELNKVNVIEKKEAENSYIYIPLNLTYSLKESKMILNNEKVIGKFPVLEKTNLEGRTVYLFEGK